MVLTVLSTSLCRKEELKAFPWIRKQTGNLMSWSCSEGEMRQHQQHLWAQRAGNTKTCLNHDPKTPGSRLALWISGCAASNDFIPKKGGHWAWGTGSSPTLPGSIPSPSPIISSRARSSSHRCGDSPGTAFHPTGPFLCQKNTARP